MKHFLSVCAIFKNESAAFEEWLNHYIREGVDHFYLIDNNSTDNYMDILRKYDCITLFKEDRNHVQIAAYNFHVFPIAIKETTYLGVFDLDEFAYATGTETIRSVLLQEPLSLLDQIWCPWTRFGSNGHIQQPASIIEGFLARRKVTENILGKSIVKMSALVKFDIHRHILVEGANDGLSDGSPNRLVGGKQPVEESQLNSFKIIVNHYEIQSYSWFHHIKKARGDVHRAICKFNDVNSFENIDAQCTIVDNTLLDKYKMP